MIFAAAALGVIGCKNHSIHTDKQVITVSIEPQRWLLEHIVGDRMEVHTLMSQGGNPENYEPSFSNMADVEAGGIYMKMGNLSFENQLIKRISSEIPDLIVINTSDAVDLITDNHGHDHGVDPHVWSSATNARIIARNMLNAVKEIDCENAEYYTENFNRLICTIDSIDSVCKEILESKTGTSFLVWHPSLSYFARDYDLHQISVGVEGKEHSVMNTRDILRTVAEEKPEVFFVQKDFDMAKASELVANNPQVKIVSINPLNYDWETEIIHTARTIAGN